MKNSKPLQLLNTDKPRESYVYDAGDNVVATPVAQTAYSRIKWRGKQIRASNLTDEIRALGNPAYFVPRAAVGSDFGVFVADKEKAHGRPLTAAFVKTLSRKDMDVIYRGLANFTNDINQLRPVKTYVEHLRETPMIINGRPVDFQDFMDMLPAILSGDDMRVLRAILDWYDWHSGIDSSYVFSHNDMHPDNLFYDKKTKTLSILDLAEAAHTSAHYQLFTDYMGWLPWLDMTRLVSEYAALDRAQSLAVGTYNVIDNMREKLGDFFSGARIFLSDPNYQPAIKITNLRRQFASIAKQFLQIKQTVFKNAKISLAANIDYNSVSGHLGRGATGSVTTRPSR